MSQRKELALAIDWESDPTTNNPCIMAVPMGLGKQEIIDLIYAEYIEQELMSGTDPTEVPYYRFEYLWHGHVNPAGDVDDCEARPEKTGGVLREAGPPYERQPGFDPVGFAGFRLGH